MGRAAALVEPELEAGEVDDRACFEWRRFDGGHRRWSASVEDEELSPPDALERTLTKSTSTRRRATGRLPSSAHRQTAFVLWPCERLFAVLNQAGHRSPCLISRT
jgi:hypothetical protein